GFAERMSTQLGIIRSLPALSDEGRNAIQAYIREQEVADKSPGVDYALRLVGVRKNLEQRLSPSDREVWEALKEFTAGNLRKESGAAIGVQEERQALERFAPVAGDTEKNRQAKLRAMEGVALTEAKKSYRPRYWDPIIRGGSAPAAGGNNADAFLKSKGV